MSGLFQDIDLPSATSEDRRRVSVLVPRPVDRVFDYRVPEGMVVSPGDYVCVSFSGREVVGVVWDGSADGADGADGAGGKGKGLKTVLERYDLPPMPSVQRRWLEWLARYYCTSLGMALKLGLSAPLAFRSVPLVKGYCLCDGFDPAKASPKQALVLKAMAGRDTGEGLRLAEIARLAGVSTAVVKGLAAKGGLSVSETVLSPPCVNPDPAYGGADLSVAQAAVADRLRAQVRDEGASCVSVLDGVTGAGKTEVYFEAIAQAVSLGRQAVLLVPEIALSHAFLSRFEARFGCAPAVWHSELTAAQRRDVWRGVASGATRVVVGARSALCLPYPKLGVIVVDEEHDPAYKQEEGVRYHARDMAVVRGHLTGCAVVLVSATPALETLYNVWEGRYQQHVLPSRYGGAQLPEVQVIDMRAHKLEASRFLAPSLCHEMEATIARAEQVLLFLNRRGYAPLTLCRSCGHRMDCPRCTAWLVMHKGPHGDTLSCHHCGFQRDVPKVCPECGDEDSLVACGPGVERVAEEVRVVCPEARVLVLASDTADTQEDLRAALALIEAGEVDVIIGTQIVAKGHHFPGLTLVGVVDADLGLKGGELRGGERVYQLLHQVAGRAGRAKKPGRVFVQTYMPDHPLMQALVAGDRDQFLRLELAEREAAMMPPFSRLVGVIVAGRDEGEAFGVARALAMAGPQDARVQTLGPMAAPMARLRGQYRFRLLVRADKAVDVQQTVRAWLAGVKVPCAVRVTVDVDPQSFM